LTKKTYRKLYVNPHDPMAGVLNSVQDHIQQSVAPLAESQIVDGNLIEGIDLTTGADNLVEHKLGREPLGWIVVRKFAAVDIYESLTDSSGSSYDRKKFINYQVGTNMTNVHFWIF
jgi:hypothetical protein|tara:strand:+ start:173 stop:520 length:348 start_codon:yes stop_codon:yes gene_type:complete